MVNQYKKEVKACENIIMIQKENESKLIARLIRKMKQQQEEKDCLEQDNGKQI